jgi:hypothetical protein
MAFSGMCSWLAQPYVHGFLNIMLLLIQTQAHGFFSNMLMACLGTCPWLFQDIFIILPVPLLSRHVNIKVFPLA